MFSGGIISAGESAAVSGVQAVIPAPSEVIREIADRCPVEFNGLEMIKCKEGVKNGSLDQIKLEQIVKSAGHTMDEYRVALEAQRATHATPPPITTPTDSSTTPKTTENREPPAQFLLLDIGAASLMFDETRFNLEKPRPGYDVNLSPVFKPTSVFNILPGAEILFKIATFQLGKLPGKTQLRFGFHYDYRKLYVSSRPEPGAIGRSPFDISRHRAGLVSEWSLFQRYFFLQFGLDFIKYAVQKQTDISKGLDVGAPAYQLADGSEINDKLGLDFRVSFVSRWPIWKDGLFTATAAFDFVSGFWNNELEIGGTTATLSSTPLAMGIRIGLVTYLF